MKDKKKRLAFRLPVIAALVLALSLGAAACNPDEPNPGPGPEPGGSISVTLDHTALTMEEFSTQEIKATVVGSSEMPSWSSSDESVATVSNGMVAAHTVGSAVITASVGGVSAACDVTVTLSDNFPVLVLSQYDVLTIAGGSVTVDARVDFMGSTAEGVSVGWRTADETIATVNNGVVTGVAVGETVVTASATYRQQLLEKQVNVKVVENSGVMVSPTNAVIYASNPAGDPSVATEIQLLVSVFDDGANVADPEIAWTSSATNVATVDDNGLVTAVSVGTAKITAAYEGGLSASCDITVEEAPTHYVLSDLLTYELVSAVAEGAPVMNEAPLSVDFGDKDIAVPADAEFFVTSAGGDEVPLTGSVNGTAISVNVAEGGFAAGDGYTLRAVSGEDWSVSMPLSVVTKVLRTVSDLQNIQAFAGFEEGDKTYEGYFVLEDNIELADTDVIANPHLPYCERALGTGLTIDGASNTEGFAGTFDGRGYTISGGSWGDGGLLGYAGKDAVVKNLALVDVTLAGTVAGGGIVAGSFFGRAENLLVDVKEVAAVAGATMRSIFGFNSGGAFVENSVFYMPVGWTYDGTQLDTAMGSGIVGGNNTFTNTYCFSAGVLGDGADFAVDFTDTGWDNFGFFATFSWAANVFNMNSVLSRYAGLNRCAADATLADAGITAALFDSAIWDMSGDKATFVSRSK